MLEKLFLHNAFHIKYHPLLYHAYFLYIHSLVQDLNTFNGQWTTTSWRQDQTTEISIIFGRAQMEERGRVGQSLFWAGNLDNAVKFNGNWELSTTGLKERRNTMQCNGNGRPSSTSLDNRLYRTSQCNAMQWERALSLKRASRRNLVPPAPGLTMHMVLRSFDLKSTARLSFFEFMP